MVSSFWGFGVLGIPPEINEIKMEFFAMVLTGFLLSCFRFSQHKIFHNEMTSNVYDAIDRFQIGKERKGFELVLPTQSPYLRGYA